MEKYQFTLEKILQNNAAIRNEDIQKILVIYLEKVFPIGDCSLRVDKLRYFKKFFAKASIDFVFANKGGGMVEEGFLANSPYLESVRYLALPDIDFEQYEAVFCIANNDEPLAEALHSKYGNRVAKGGLATAVFTIKMLLPVEKSKFVFPVHEALTAFIGNKPGNLHITPEEREWADRWLESNGLKKHESLYILLDSTSRQHKLLGINVYFEYLTHLLQKKDVRVLNFDEGGLGKETFYREWLGERMAGKMIFSRGLSLRQALSILASGYTRFVFGPCTGLMHCVSSIYNSYVQAGMPMEEAPLLVVYTGKYPPGEKAFDWWGNSPLIRCLLLKNRNGRKEIAELAYLREEEKCAENTLPCSAYTAPLLSEYTDFMFRSPCCNPPAFFSNNRTENWQFY